MPIVAFRDLGDKRRAKKRVDLLRSWSRPELCAILLLLSIGPALIALHPSIPFLNDGICDAWYVFGLFYHLPDALQWPLKDAVTIPYQTARLSNLVPGYLLTRAFNGIAADYAMFLIYYSTSVFFFYRSIRILMGDKVALFAAIFFAVHPLIIANFSVTFASGAVLYSIISFYFVARAMDAEDPIRKTSLIFVSGIAIGAAFHVHLGIVIYAVANYLMYLFYVLLYSRETMGARIWHIARAALAALAGAVGFTVALGGVAILFGGSFSLVFEQFWFISYEFWSEARKEWSVPDWYWHGATVGIFVTALLLSAINIYSFSSKCERTALSENARRRVLALSWAILAQTVLCLVYAALDGGMVQRDFYYVFFVPYLAAVIFSPLLVVGAGKSRATIGGAIVFLICGLGASGLNEHLTGALHRTPIEAIASVTAAIFAGLIYGYFVLSARTGTARKALYVGLALLMLIIVRPEETGVGIWNSPRDLHLAREYQRIREGLALLNTVHFERRPQFWIDTESGPSELFAYPQSYFYCAFQKSFPAIDQESWNWKNEYEAPQQFTLGHDVVVISRRPNLRSTAEAAFAALGLAVERVEDFTLHLGRTSYELLIEHVEGLDNREKINLPIASFRPVNGGSVSVHPDGLSVTTAPQQWSYSVFESLRDGLENVRGPIGVRMHLWVEEGVIGVAVSARGNVGDLLTRKDEIRPGKDQEVCLTVPDASAVDLLIIQNESQHGPSRATLSSVDLFKLGSAPQQQLNDANNCEHRRSAP